MKKDYFKDGESKITTILAKWQTDIRKSTDENLNRSFYQLQNSFTKFQVELMKSECKGYFSNEL